MNLRTIIGLIPILMLISQSACCANVTFQGKVIDADTLKPIEGAVVIATWNEERGTPAGTDTRFKDAKETLTDKNGEWTITGPEGNADKLIGIVQVIGVFVTTKPVFLIYKPGYRNDIRGGFSAYPYINKKHDLEGIVLVRGWETKQEREKYHKRFGDFLPFIPLKDPERKLRDLNFSFEYPENVKTVGWRKEMPEVYQVIGLKKAQTREERLEAMGFTAPGKLPLAHKMQWEERERLLGPVRGKKK